MSYYLYKGILYDTESLKHYGVLGMKWGVRRYQNEDGTLTSAGKKRYSNEWVKIIKKPNTFESPEKIFEEKAGLSGKPFDGVRKSLENDSKVLNELNKEAIKLMADYDNNIHTYTTMAGIVAALEYNGDNVDMDTIGRDMWFYDCEDGDQGTINSRSLFTVMNNKVEEAHNLSKQINEAEDRYLETAKKATKELLGEYGDTPVYKIGKYSVADSIAEQMQWSDNRIKKAWSLYEADEWTKVTDSQKSSIDKAKAAIANLDFGKQGAWNIVEAIENAGLSSTKFNEMTTADWLKINSELKKLEGTW